VLPSESAAQSAAPATLSGPQPTASANRADKALDVESLPVEETPSERSGAPAASVRGKKGKKGDKNEMALESELKGDTPASDAPRTGSDKAAEESAADRPTTPVGIDQAAANAALAAAAAAARACRSYGQAPSPTGRAAVTFSPDGSVSAVSISQNFIGTPIGNCVIGHYRNARVSSFVGDPTTLFSTFDVSN